MRERERELGRARSVLRVVAFLSPVMIGVVLFIALRDVLDRRLLQAVVFGAVVLDGVLMLVATRLVSRKFDRLRMDCRMGQVEEHVVQDPLKGDLSRTIGRVDFASLKRACGAFVQSGPSVGKKGTARIDSAFLLFAGLGPLRVVLLPRSRIVLKVESLAEK